MTYGGDVTPAQCWENLSQSQNAVLVDVRTQAEWSFVGVPNLQSGMQPIIGQSWQIFPTMQVDEGFVERLVAQLQDRGLDQSCQMHFLCKTGVRSLAAARAMYAAGYENTFNILGGFEGDADENSHRGKINGWKGDNLPWKQG